MIRYPVRLALVVLCLEAAACGDAESDAVVPAPPPDITFGPLGSIASPGGAGSFRFGASTAATQIEDDNDRTDWWAFTAPEAEGGLAKGPFVGDASMGFTRALQDVDLVLDAGLEAYRFSIEWARVEPEKDQIDESALAHYRALLEALVDKGIRPMVTLHHFSNPVWVDDPRALECEGGPTDENLCGLGDPLGGPLVVEQMAEHATLLAERFGDVVDEWGTLNEPVNYLVSSYGVGVFPPGKQRIFNLLEEFIPVVRDYVEGHARMAAAVRAADVVDADGDGSPADVGLTLSVQQWAPARFNEPSDLPEDVTATERVAYVYHHLLVDALTTGSFDSDLDGTGDEAHPSWERTLDWLGLQYYARIGVTGNNGLLPVLEATPCYGTFDFGSCLPPEDPTWDVPTMRYEFWAPGLYERLVEFSARYPGLPLLVTESGLATEVGRRRAEHVVRSLEQLDRARSEGVDVRGYYHWSLYDNFEWIEGFEPRFGLYRVDFDTYERTPTEGALVLGDIARARTLTSEGRQAYGGMGPMTPEP